MSQETVQTKKIHRNIPQLTYQIVKPAVGVCIWGRRTGKTEGPIVDFTLDNIFTLQGCNGFIIGSTYKQLLEKTIPPLIAGWERYGYRENEHFWIGKYAPEELMLPKAYKHPIEPKHYIQWYNGSGIYLFSQDIPGSMNGAEAQWGLGDEARFLDREKMTTNLIQIMTGRADVYGHLSNYLSLLWCSDMPQDTKGRWLLDYKKHEDPEVLQKIFEVHGEIVRRRKEYQAAPDSKKKKLRPALQRLYDALNELRKGTVYVSLASTLDNIHVVGLTPIRNYIRELSDPIFQLTVLNKQVIKKEKGFYSLLDEDDHGYVAIDYDYIQKLKWSYRKPEMQDCRWDKDIDTEQPLSIACDHNNAINYIATGQEIGNEGRLLSTKWVTNPEMLSDMVKLWDKYYRHHPIREVNYIYDSTSVGGDASDNISFSDEVALELTKLDWIVNRIDIGQIGSHHSRFFFWGKMLQGTDRRLPRFRFNKSNNPDWIIAAQQAGILKAGEKIKKDKRSEKDPNVPPQHATHATEAVDILMWGMYRPRIGDESSFIDNMYT
jgi:hypothetical protein